MKTKICLQEGIYVSLQSKSGLKMSYYYVHCI